MSDKWSPESEVELQETVPPTEQLTEEVNGEVLMILTKDTPVPNNLKLAKDGRTILIPQPSDDPKDPLNWSSFKKHMILLLVAFGSFAGDYGTAAGIPAIGLQTLEWHLSSVVVATYPNNLATLMAGISGIIWMPLTNAWGRMPVLFWSSLLGLIFTLACILVNDFDTFYALRVLQGVNQTVGQTIGLAFIEDMFFLHQHARKIGIWYAIFICSPFLSPLFGNFIIGTLGRWRPVFWTAFGWSVFLVCLIVAFGDESYYLRSRAEDRQPPRPRGHLNRFSRVLGLWQLRHHHGYFPTVFSSYRRLVEVFFKPVIPLMMLFYSITFMWFIGITVSSSILLETPTADGGYGLGPISIGYLFFTPIVSVLLGEAFGHFFNDYIARRYAERHHGRFVPEARIGTTYLGGFLLVPGLIIVGQTLQHHLSQVALIFGWGAVVTGTMLTSVATVAYVQDCYPAASGEVSALINMGRVGGGFSVAYFQQAWGQKQGYDVAFGLQAVIVVCAYAIVVGIQLYGARLRAWAGPVGELTLSVAKD